MFDLIECIITLAIPPYSERVTKFGMNNRVIGVDKASSAIIFFRATLDIVALRFWNPYLFRNTPELRSSFVELYERQRRQLGRSGNVTQTWSRTYDLPDSLVPLGHIHEGDMAKRWYVEW